LLFVFNSYYYLCRKNYERGYIIQNNYKYESILLFYDNSAWHDAVYG
jgi:hypothetical protein